MVDRHSRSAVYALLGRLFVREVDRETLAFLNESPVREQLIQFGFELPAAEGADSFLEEMGFEYCRIFLGPQGHIPPMQSVCESGLLRGPAADSMESYLEFVTIDRMPDTLVDHFGFQLEVMGTILGSETADEDLAVLAEISRRFFRDHLHWSRAMLERAAVIASVPFYRSLIRMAREFLTDEAAIMGVATSSGKP